METKDNKSLVADRPFDPSIDQWRSDLVRDREKIINDMVMRFPEFLKASHSTMPREPQHPDDFYSMSHMCWLLKKLKQNPFAPPKEFYTRYGFLLGLLSAKYPPPTIEPEHQS